MEILAFIIGAYLIYIAQNVLYRRFWNKGLNVFINVSSHDAFEGETLTLTETITNRKLLPLPSLKVKFMTSATLLFDSKENASITDHYYRTDLFSIMMYQELTRKLQFVCSHRGYYSFSSLTVICSNLLYTSELVKDFPCDHYLYVYPKQIKTEKLLPVFRKMFGPVLTKRYINEDPFEFRSIREYNAFDSIRTVNWKASAKTGELKVNTHEYTSSQQFRIFLNLEAAKLRKQNDLLEESIRIASSIAAASIEKGISISLSSNALEHNTPIVLTLPEGSGKSHLKSCNELLSRIDTSLEMPDFLSTCEDELLTASENDYCIIISTYQREDLQNVLRQLKHLRRDFLWIVPVNAEIAYEVHDDLMEEAVKWEVTYENEL